MVINTNTPAAFASRILAGSSSNLAKSLAKLSSGSKIISPEDDAAGLAVSMKFSAELTRIGAARSNVGNTISYSQTQDGFLSKIDTALRRMSELSMLAGDNTKSAGDVSNYNLEFAELKQFITASSEKTFNGVNLFGTGTIANKLLGDANTANTETDYNVLFDTNNDGTETDGTYHTWVAAPSTDDNTNYTLLKIMREDIADLTLEVDSVDLDATSTANYIGSAWANTVSFWEGKLGRSYTDAKNHAGTVLANAVVPVATKALGADAIASYKALALDIQDYVKNKMTANVKVTDSSDGTTYDLNNASLNTLTTGIATGGDINSALTASNAGAYVSAINTHIANLAASRANVGANISRLNMVDSQLAVYSENLAAAHSRIADVDVAVESANYAKQQILVQSGTAMLAQANMMPQSALMLIQ